MTGPNWLIEYVRLQAKADRVRDLRRRLANSPPMMFPMKNVCNLFVL